MKAWPCLCWNERVLCRIQSSLQTFQIRGKDSSKYTEEREPAGHFQAPHVAGRVGLQPHLKSQRRKREEKKKIILHFRLVHTPNPKFLQFSGYWLMQNVLCRPKHGSKIHTGARSLFSRHGADLGTSETTQERIRLASRGDRLAGDTTEPQSSLRVARYRNPRGNKYL